MIKKDFASYDDTLKALKSTIKQWDRIEKVAITNTLGRILATDIIAKDSYPSHPVAAMDGYACKSQDLKEGAVLNVLGDLPAGTGIKNIIIKKGECLKTFTGSLMCKGSDTLIPIEYVSVKNSTITINKTVKTGFSVRPIGESYLKDEILLKKGTKLSYSEIALLAELGIFHVSVFVKPKIAILSTGNEIKDLGETLENSAQIHSSNHIALANMARLMGCESMICPIAKDDAKTVQDAIVNALQSCDILLTTGGVSVGDYDFVQSAMKQEFNLIVDGADIKPGRHIKIAKSKEKYIFALPGFPYSAMVMCVLYVRVLLNEMLETNENYEVEAVLKEDYHKKTPFLEFSAATLEFQNGQIFVTTNNKKSGSSAIINNLNQNAALIICPKEKENGMKAGDIVKVLKMV